MQSREFGLLLVQLLQSQGAEISPDFWETMEEYWRYRNKKEYEERLKKLKLEEVIGSNLRKLLEEQSSQAVSEWLREIARRQEAPVPQEGYELIGWMDASGEWHEVWRP